MNSRKFVDKNPGENLRLKFLIFPGACVLRRGSCLSLVSRQSMGGELASISVDKKVGSTKALGLHSSMAGVPLSSPDPVHG